MYIHKHVLHTYISDIYKYIHIYIYICIYIHVPFWAHQLSLGSELDNFNKNHSNVDTDMFPQRSVPPVCRLFSNNKTG